MPIKKKVPVKKAAVKKVVIGPKAKLMKLAVTTLRTKAKKLGVSDVTKRTKENLAQSILLGEARKKRGTAAGKKATAKRAVSTTRQKVEGLNIWAAKPKFAYRQTGTSNEARDALKEAKLPGKRTSASGNVYYERRRNRSDNPFRLHGPEDPGNDLSKLGYREVGMLAQLLQAWSDQKLSSLAKKYFAELEDWGYNSKSGFVFLVDIYYNVLMYNDSIKKLDLFLSTPYEGQEGFIEDLLIDFKTLDEEDQDFVERYYKDLDAAEKRAYKKPVG